ncbi:hypothetical protein MMC16_005830 [Acarospora aff. strigata]|nr:hypothetical protein [Acarospora aff. strigata]
MFPPPLHLPPIHHLPTLPTPQLTQLLSTLFEPCPALCTLSLPLLRSQTFDSYAALIGGVGLQLSALSGSGSDSDSEGAVLERILGAHPRLGVGVKEEVGGSGLSRGEQAGLNRRSGAGVEEVEEERGRLRGLNEEYERVFGFGFVTFVDGRGRKEIMEEMEARIERRDGEAEKAVAIKAICDIAADRARKLLSSAP